MLLVGASLLGRSVMRIADVDRGYEPAGLLTARLSLPSTMYTPERRFAVVTGKLSDTPGAVETAPPTLGQHTRTILREDLGLTAEEIEALSTTRAI